MKVSLMSVVRKKLETDEDKEMSDIAATPAAS